MDKKNTNTKMAFFYHNKNKQKLLKSNQTCLKTSTNNKKEQIWTNNFNLIVLLLKHAYFIFQMVDQIQLGVGKHKRLLIKSNQTRFNWPCILPCLLFGIVKWTRLT